MGKGHQGKLTPKNDTKGIEVTVCDVTWFDPAVTYSIANSPERTAGLIFTASDLNYFARVLFAEASGTGMLPDVEVRRSEKEAMINVFYFRLNRRNYPTYKAISKTFTEVCNAPNQFETVYPTPTTKMVSVTGQTYRKLKNGDCADLQEAIDSIKAFLSSGPNSNYVYDNFRGGIGEGKQGKQIGKSRFWLSPTGRNMFEKTP